MAADELKTLFPSLSDDEIALAKENLGRYVLLAWEIYEDRRAETDARAVHDGMKSSVEKENRPLK